MKSYLLIFLFGFGISVVLSGQITTCHTDNRVKQFLSDLSNDECSVSYNYIPQFHVSGENALELIKLKTTVSCDLYHMLLNDENVLISHAILSYIYCKASDLSFYTEYLWNESYSEVIGMKHTFNHLSWTVENETLSFDEESKKWIEEYWRKKIEND